MNFPRLVRSQGDRYLYIFILLGITIILYRLTNRIHIYEPALLPMWKLDEWTPFMPWTIWVYITEYIIFFVAMFGLRDPDLATKYFLSYMAIFLISLVFFILWPITFPRENFPLIDMEPSVSTWALGFLREHMDTPANCLPSLHVSSCFISALCFKQENKKIYYWMMIWSVLVSISTMTTKQHYFVDILAALILTVPVYYYFFYKVKLR